MANQGRNNSADYKPRAPRFPLRIPFRYRQSSETHWHECKTVNISRTGVLFRAEQDIQPGSVLDMRIILPVEMTGKSLPTAIICWGPVVRSQLPEFPEIRPALAAVIRNYRLQAGSATSQNRK